MDEVSQEYPSNKKTLSAPTEDLTAIESSFATDTRKIATTAVATATTAVDTTTAVVVNITPSILSEEEQEDSRTTSLRKGPKAPCQGEPSTTKDQIEDLWRLTSEHDLNEIKEQLCHA